MAKSEDLLYRSFDDNLSPAEQRQLDEALAASNELREKKASIESMRQQLVELGEDASFRPMFADRVMRKIRSSMDDFTQRETLWDGLIKAFRPVAIAATIAVIALASYNMFRSQSVSVSGVMAEPELTLEQVLDPTFAMTLE